MGYKNVKYFLTDGTLVERNGLYVPYHGDYINGVSDISYMDDVTLELGPDIKEKLIECNPYFKLTDNRNYKITKDHKTPRFLSVYEPVTNLDRDLSKTKERLFSEFRDLVSNRIMAYEGTGKVSKLDDIIVQRFRDDLLEAIYKLPSGKRRAIFDSTSIIAKDAKNYYYSNTYKFKNIYMIEYANLRNLFIMYLAVLEDRRKPNINSLYEIYNNFDNIKRIDYKDPTDIKKELEDYKKALLEIKNKEELDKKVKDLMANGTQMTIADLDPSQAHYFNKK